MRNYDVVIIGAGVAGLTSAKICANHKLNVCLIERRDVGGRSLHGGGTFINHLFQSIKMLKTMRKNDLWSIKADPSSVEIDFEALFRAYRGRKDQLRQKIVDDIKGLDIDFLVGHAVLLDPYTIDVAGEQLRAKHIIIAHGSKLRIPDIKGLKKAMQEEFVKTPTEIANIRKKPTSVVVFGGGRIAFEMTELFSRMDVHVTMISKEKVLNDVDLDVKDQLISHLDHDYVKIIEEYEDLSIEGQTVRYRKDKEDSNVSPDFVILAMGYILDEEVLGNVTLDKNDDGIITDRFCRTSIEHVFAIGDANHRKKLSNLATKEGEIAANFILGTNQDIEYHQYVNGIMGVYDYAFIGKDEFAIKTTGEPYFVMSFDMRDKDRVFSNADTLLVKMMFSKVTHKVLGIHVVGEQANDELAQLYSLMGSTYIDHKMGLPIHSHLQEIKERVDTIDHELTHELIDDSMKCVYQKIVNNKTYHLAGYESFSRFMIEDRIWRPLPIIEMLEQSGLITILDLKSLTKAGKYISKLQQELDHQHVRISINVSSVSLQMLTIDDFVEAMKHCGCDHKQIIIEVTERQIINHPHVLEMLKGLKEAGFLISLDDFSMGHSSLPLLYQFSFDEIKLDRELLPKNAQDNSSMKTYKYLVKMLKEHKVEIVAEGIETAFHVAFLKDLDVDRLQGYYFSQPTLEEDESLIKRGE